MSGNPWQSFARVTIKFNADCLVPQRPIAAFLVAPQEPMTVIGTAVSLHSSDGLSKLTLLEMDFLLYFRESYPVTIQYRLLQRLNPRADAKRAPQRNIWIPEGVPLEDTTFRGFIIMC